jgi:hypothetical protein
MITDRLPVAALDRPAARAASLAAAKHHQARPERPAARAASSVRREALAPADVPFVLTATTPRGAAPAPAPATRSTGGAIAASLRATPAEAIRTVPPHPAA